MNTGIRQDVVNYIKTFDNSLKMEIMTEIDVEIFRLLILQYIYIYLQIRSKRMEQNLSWRQG